MSEHEQFIEQVAALVQAAPARRTPYWLREPDAGEQERHLRLMRKQLALADRERRVADNIQSRSWHK